MPSKAQQRNPSFLTDLWLENVAVCAKRHAEKRDVRNRRIRRMLTLTLVIAAFAAGCRLYAWATTAIPL
jgi:hypothetical protein